MHKVHFLSSLTSTPLEQNPYIDRGPIVGKVLIVCPVTLINVRPFIVHTASMLIFGAELEERVSQVVSA